MAIKTREEIEQRKQDFIDGVPAKDIIDKESIWSLAHLKRLTNEQIVERMEQIDNQAFLYTCRLLYELRKRFASDMLFGQYLDGLRNHPEYPIKLGGQPRVTKMIHVGKFCEDYSISDINKAGILQSAIVELARPANKDVAKVVLHQVRRGNKPLKVVLALIQKEKDDLNTILSIEKGDNDISMMLESETQEDFDLAASKPRYTVEVEHSVVEREIDGVVVRDMAQTAIVPPAANLSVFGFTTKSAPIAIIDPVEELTEEQLDNIRRRTELLNELATISATMLTEEQRVAELILLSSAYDLAPIKLIPTFQACSKHLQKEIWGK